jgi:hypothetical protein
VGVTMRTAFNQHGETPMSSSGQYKETSGRIKSGKFLAYLIYNQLLKQASARG